ncbi:MAG: putative colanic acid biosynthesis acetyltransferase [Planctomycetota bacterium]
MTSAPDANAATALDRGTSPYSTKEKIGRLLWDTLGQRVFRCTFHTWYGLRASILRAFGATIAGNTRIRATVRVEIPWNLTVGTNSSIGDRATLYCLGPVTLGDNVSISQNAHICAGTHDFTKPDLPLLRPPITIEDDAWIAADAFVGPNITVGRGAILGARGCAFKDLDPWTIYGGNPAKAIAERPRFSDENQA